ncbi:hypothetical protein BC941DRAFT_485939 [Chlamydoabsidia padenii]|nr:hypothetical protein BC941DRAFT_485939 [Chlamydoabsidia padenii]
MNSDENDGMDPLDFMDPLFHNIEPSHLMDNISSMDQQPYHDHDIPSPSSSVHDSSSSSSTTTTPSPKSQYDVLPTDKHVIPTDLLNGNDNNRYMISTMALPDSYHRLTAEYYARNTNIFNSSNESTDESSLDNGSTLDDSLQIRVLGVPNLGAKSRVETQIKLCIQLMTSNGTKVPNWSYLRLPETMLARSKLRKSQQQKLLDGSVATMVSDESKVLTLDARVICSTDATKTVRMCPGCVRRERKRAERTKDGKPRYEADLTSTTTPGDQTTHDMDLKQRAENMLEKDRDRILLFNCSPMVNFSSGDTILPTRITCYCRHHNEKVGFRIQFVMRNNQGSIVAKGCSPPIMITDDHKSSKQRNNSISDEGTTNDTTNKSNSSTTRKRGRADYENNQQSLDTPAPSRRGSMSSHHHQQQQQQYNNTIPSTPLQMNPSASFGIPSSVSSPYQYDQPSPPTDSMTTPNSSLSSSPQMMLIGNDLAMTPLPTMEDSTSYALQHTMGQDTIQTSYLMNGTSQHESVSTTDYNNQATNNDDGSSSFYYSNGMTENGTPSTAITAAPWPQNRRRRLANHEDDGFFMTDEATSVWRRMDHQQNTPQLERLVPAQGPTYGGVEVTVLGSGFYRGLTCLFGEHAASTVYWNPNTLVCVLPPAVAPGPVVVSFKEHHIVLEGQDVALFTYYDASDQALLELALQVVGMKMTGKIECPKHVAMLIVRGDQQRSQQDHHGTNHTGQQQQQEEDNTLENETTSDDDDSFDGSICHESDNLENHIMNALEATNSQDVMQTNPNGHTMLHLAVLLRYGALTKMLINKMNDQVINQPDRNGCTALHFACLSNSAPMVQLLLDAGAQPTEKCSMGSALTLATDPLVRSILVHSLSTTMTAKPVSPPLPRRLSFKSHVRRFYTLKQQTSAADHAADDLDNNGLGFVQYKHDRRLYLFWLPLLIGKFHLSSYITYT